MKNDLGLDIVMKQVEAIKNHQSLEIFREMISVSTNYTVEATLCKKTPIFTDLC